MDTQRGFHRAAPIGLALLLLLSLSLVPPSPARAQGAVTKGAFVERFFLNRFTRPPAARAYLPAGAEALPPAERYAAVVKGLSERGVMILTGTKADDPLTRVEYITLTYLLAGGRPGRSLAEQKDFLKARGVLDPNDIGLIKAFQGTATVTRAGQERPRRITGAEPVMFRDLDETELGARLELLFDDGSALTIGEDTAMTIDEMVYDPKTTRRSIRLRVAVGTIRVKAAKNTHPDSRFEVVTPSLVAGVRGTEFIVTVDPQGRTILLAIEGLLGARQVGADPRTEVRIERGQKAAAAPGEAVGPAQTASQAELQRATQATTVTAPAPTAAVSQADAGQTETLVQVEIKQPAEQTVTSKEETSKKIEERPIKDDKGESTEEVTTTGSVGKTRLTTENTPVANPEGQVRGKTGDELKKIFLGFPDSVQAGLFGVLTTAQQVDLVGRLTLSEGEALLARFRPGSPFAPEVLESLREFWNALEAQSGARTLLGALFDNLTPAQAEALVPARPLAEIAAFFGGVTAAARSAILNDLSPAQAEKIVASGVSGSVLAEFFDGISPTARAAVLDDLSSSQGATVLAGRSGADLKTIFLGLRDRVQADDFGALTSAQQGDLLRQLVAVKTQNGSQFLDAAEAEALLGRFQSASPFTPEVLKSLLDFGAAASALNIDVSTTTNGSTFTTTLNAVGLFIDNVTPEQAVEFVNCSVNDPGRKCVEEAEFAWFVDVPGSNDLTEHGARVATALSRELDRLARAGGTLIAPGPEGFVDQMLLVTTLDDTVILPDFPMHSPGDIAWFVAEELMLNLDELGVEKVNGSLVNVLVNVNDQDIQDVWGGGMRPSVYSNTSVAGCPAPCNNGGFQAGQLRASARGARGGDTTLIDVSGRVAALNNNGFLAYAVQVEEDIVNALAMVISELPGGLSPEFPGDKTIRVDGLVETQLELASIRQRDAALAQLADARAGAVLFDSGGDRVRVQQYVYRSSSNPDEIRMASISLRESDAPPTGLHYIDLRVEFQLGELSGKSAIGIRDMPWNSYFTLLYNGPDCSISPCSAQVGSPVGSPALANMRVELGNGRGDFLREEILGFGPQVCCEDAFNFQGQLVKSQSEGFHHQHPSFMRLTVRKADQSPQVFQQGVSGFVQSNPATFGEFFYDPRAGSSLSPNPVPDGEYRVRPIRFGPQAVIDLQDKNNPAGFNYVAVPPGGGAPQFFAVRFAVLGDSTAQANAGRQTSTCGAGGASPCGFDAIRFDTIWDAFRVNIDDSIGNPDDLPTINIGANNLEIRVPATLSIAGQQPFAQTIRPIFLPFPRMIWRGESGF